MKIESTDIYYKVSFTKEVDPIDGSKYYTEYNGEIMLDDDTKIGEFKISKVKLTGAVDNRDENLFDTTDVTQIVSDVASEIFDRKFQVKDRVIDGDFCSGNFTIIESVELEPNYRGMNIGLYVIRDFISNYVDSDEIVAIFPSPLSKDTEHETDEEIAKRRLILKKHWAKLGFKSYPKQDYMLFKACCVLRKVEIKNKKLVEVAA